MSSSAVHSQIDVRELLPRGTSSNAERRSWFAVFTIPQNEKSVVRHLEVRDVESFLPTYESVRLWKNRQKVTILAPLFPTYLFVHIGARERGKVLQCPGVVQIVGGKETIAVSDAEIELLRSSCGSRRVEPCNEFETGEEVRVKRGMLRGVRGTFVRKASGTRFVIKIELINQSAAIQVEAIDLERADEYSSSRPEYEASLESFRANYEGLKNIQG